MRTTLRALSPARSMRVRLTMVGTAVLLVGLGAGAFAFAQVFERQLIDDLDVTLSNIATDRARSVDAGLDPATQLATEQAETAVAVFAADGTVLANRSFTDPASLLPMPISSPQTMVLDYTELEGPDQVEEVERAELRVYAAQPGDTIVVVAAELEQVDKNVGRAVGLLAAGVPFLTLAGGAVLWLVIGRALRPVDHMQRDARAVAGLGGEQRVHDPGTEDELGRLASTLNEMLDRLGANAESMRQFVSDASHEIRSPIANIRARVETADPDDWALTRTDVIGEVVRIETIIDDLTYLARSDEGRTARRLARVELDDVLFAAGARLQRSEEVVARGISVDVSEVEPIVISADRSEVDRVVRNLADNAARHAAAAIRLAVHEADGHAVIEVDDDGPGIPAGERSRVLQRFVRLDESRQRASGGTGLGLAIVDEIVDGHGGSMTIETAPLGGARIVVRLPIEAASTNVNE